MAAFATQIPQISSPVTWHIKYLVQVAGVECAVYEMYVR